MTKSDLADKYWLEYLVWCSSMPDASASGLFKWLKFKDPTEPNFWLWFVEVKKGKVE